MTEKRKKVLAAKKWTTNGHLIADVAQLYLHTGMRTLDPTFGAGVWWKVWRPDELVCHSPDIDGPSYDFRRVDEPSASFDLIAYDPPYVTIGGRSTSSIQDFHRRYGLMEVPKVPEDTQQLMHDGLDEMRRLIRPGGIILAKCKAYVWNGKVWWGDDLLQAHAAKIGLRKIDRFEFINASEPIQPERWKKHRACKGRGCELDGCVDGRVLSEQEHAARNLSTLFVLQADGKPEAELFPEAA